MPGVLDHAVGRMGSFLATGAGEAFFFLAALPLVSRRFFFPLALDFVRFCVERLEDMAFFFPDFVTLWPLIPIASSKDIFCVFIVFTLVCLFEEFLVLLSLAFPWRSGGGIRMRSEHEEKIKIKQKNRHLPTEKHEQK